MSDVLHITDHTLLPEGREAFGIDAAEDIKGMGADCVVMAVSHDAFKDITLGRAQRCDVMNSDPVLVGIRGMFCGEDGILLQGAVNGWGGWVAYREHSVGVVT